MLFCEHSLQHSKAHSLLALFKKYDFFVCVQKLPCTCKSEALHNIMGEEGRKNLQNVLKKSFGNRPPVTTVCYNKLKTTNQNS